MEKIPACKITILNVHISENRCLLSYAVVRYYAFPLRVITPLRKAGFRTDGISRKQTFISTLFNEELFQTLTISFYISTNQNENYAVNLINLF